MPAKKITYARLEELTSSRFDDVLNFFKEQSRGGVTGREKWEFEYALQNQSFFAIVLEPSEEIIAVSGIWAYPQVNRDCWSRESPESLDENGARAHELGGSLVARGYQGFGMQKVFLSARMAFVRVNFANFAEGDGEKSVEHIGIAITNDKEKGGRSVRNVEATGFMLQEPLSSVHSDFLYPCFECELFESLKKKGSCVCYDFYSATFEDYQTQAWLFKNSPNWNLIRQKRYRKADDSIAESDSTMMVVKNATGLFDKIRKVDDIA